MRGMELVDFGRPLEPFERATPTPAGAEVLLEVCAAGVCHSDLHLSDGYYELGCGDRLLLGERGVRPPLTLGHEVVGRVVAVGGDANPDLIGRSFLVYPWIGCQACATCLGGDYNACAKPQYIGIHRPGGYGDHVIAPHERFLIDIGGLEPAAAAPYACSGLTAFRALKRIGFERLRSRPVVLIGAGGLGLMALTLLSALEAHGAVVVELDADKRRAALDHGALAAIDAGAGDVARQIEAACGGAPLAVVDFVGSTETACLAIGVLGRGGQYVVVGLFGGSVTLPLPLVAIRAISIEGTNVGSLGDLNALMQLVRAGCVPPMSVQTYAAADANLALDALRERKVVGRAILQREGATA